jgi:hypothetical protein
MRKAVYLALVLAMGCAHASQNVQASSGNAPTPAGSSIIVTRSPWVSNNAAFFYDQIQGDGSGVEFAVCVYGADGRTYVYLEYVMMTFIDDADWGSVNYQICPRRRNFLGIGHSHPPGSACDLSDVDWNTFYRNRYRYAFLICADRVIKAYARSEIPASAQHVPISRRDSTSSRWRYSGGN